MCFRSDFLVVFKSFVCVCVHIILCFQFICWRFAFVFGYWLSWRLVHFYSLLLPIPKLKWDSVVSINWKHEQLVLEILFCYFFFLVFVKSLQQIFNLPKIDVKITYKSWIKCLFVQSWNLRWWRPFYIGVWFARFLSR